MTDLNVSRKCFSVFSIRSISLFYKYRPFLCTSIDFCNQYDLLTEINVCMLWFLFIFTYKITLINYKIFSQLQLVRLYLIISKKLKPDLNPNEIKTNIIICRYGYNIRSVLTLSIKSARQIN